MISERILILGPAQFRWSRNRFARFVFSQPDPDHSMTLLHSPGSGRYVLSGDNVLLRFILSAGHIRFILKAWYICAVSFCVKSPVMKKTSKLIALYFAFTQMRSHVWAIGI